MAHVRKRVFATIHRLPTPALLLVFLCALLFVAEARAVPLLTLQTHSNVQAPTDGAVLIDQDSIDLFSPGPLPVTHNPRLSAVGSFGSSTLDMDLESSFGHLGARLDARSSITSIPDIFLVEPIQTGGVSANTLTTTFLSWDDTLTVLSPILAQGTPVDIVARLSLTGNVGTAGLTSLMVDTTFGPSEVLPRSLQAGLTVGVGSSHIFLDPSSTLREPVATIDEFGATVFTVTVGQSFDISGFLQFGTTTLAFFDNSGGVIDFEPISNLLVDASNSARFGIEVLTAGASLDSESGATYPTDPRAISQIPEPATLALFGAGLLALGFLRRRRVRAA